MSRTQPMSRDTARISPATFGHDLRGASTDVEDDDRGVADREVTRGAGIGQLPLFLSRQELGRRADDLGRREEELLAVVGVPDGGRGDQTGAAPTPSASMSER